MIRAFLALPIPDDIRQALAVQQSLLPLPHTTDPDDFHLTLVFLGETPDHVLEAADDGFQTLRSPGLTLTINGFGLFGGDRPRTAHATLAPNHQLTHLQARAHRRAVEAGCDLRRQRFVPHVTLGRFPPPAPPDALRLERAVALTPFTSRPFAVTEARLMRSTLSPRGARHDVLARYPLSDDDQTA